MPSITHFRQKGKKYDKSHKKNIKSTEITLSNLMISMLRRKIFQKNMLNKGQVKVDVLTVENLDTLKIVRENLVN